MEDHNENIRNKVAEALRECNMSATIDSERPRLAVMNSQCSEAQSHELYNSLKRKFKGYDVMHARPSCEDSKGCYLIAGSKIPGVAQNNMTINYEQKAEA